MDPDAWSRLATTFGPIVYKWCRVSNVPMSDAADVVQDVFASVARGISDFERQKQEGSFRSWLATITRNRTADYFRRAAKAQAAIGGTDAMLAMQRHAESLESTISEASVEAAISHQLLQQVRAEFETATWDAFWLTTIEEKSASEAAEITGLSRASVYQAKSRILRRLRQRLET
ncbi:RNA polymerase sigma factor CnrH [Planctomycetes bacterium CA13]|uniref:RNA polymerase sigma factor CnrH n=2 Tax=Novipirellula herctigrandis TaxID=2527986 RepID=A0A5C5Z7P4_9BACT|nr:RNA polymerase sigma factor CnrH [Planctomycetes bacterium CA13]